ncbi:MAG: peptide chain release factor 2 [Deltaproteobacteria bacterium]|nr:peptide chain release factor 2 [Deltaproteobacteria bacterium]
MSKSCWLRFESAKPPSGGFFDLEERQKKLKVLEEQSASEGFWNRPNEERTNVLREVRLIQLIMEDWQKLAGMVEELETGVGLAKEAEDASLLTEMNQLGETIAQRLEQLEMKNLLGGEHDQKDAIVMVHSGAGGTESADWTAMLYRMYTRWVEDHGYKLTEVDFQPGEEAGIRSVTFEVAGEFAYGYLKAEVGVHRLVRISPFDSAKRRHTSFASVFVYPDIEASMDIEILESDLQIDTYRAQGAGGQHVNTTDSAVRITHRPSGIVVACQNERSQHKNRSTAMKVLKAKLYDKRVKELEAERDKRNSTKRTISWGSQIRSYVLHPYQMVKDHRTDEETSATQAVLDGHIDHFIHQALMKKVV